MPYFKRIPAQQKQAFLIKVEIALHTFVNNYPVLAKILKICFIVKHEILNNQDGIRLQTSCTMLVRNTSIETHKRVHKK